VNLQYLKYLGLLGVFLIKKETYLESGILTKISSNMSLCCSDSTTSPEGCMSIVEEKQPSNLIASVKLSYRTYKSNIVLLYKVSTTSPEGCMSIVEEKQPSNLTASVKLSYRTL
jgi:peptide deformylase